MPGFSPRADTSRAWSATRIRPTRSRRMSAACRSAAPRASTSRRIFRFSGMPGGMRRTSSSATGTGRSVSSRPGSSSRFCRAARGLLGWRTTRTCAASGRWTASSPCRNPCGTNWCGSSGRPWGACGAAGTRSPCPEWPRRLRRGRYPSSAFSGGSSRPRAWTSSWMRARSSRRAAWRSGS